MTFYEILKLTDNRIVFYISVQITSKNTKINYKITMIILIVLFIFAAICLYNKKKLLKVKSDQIDETFRKLKMYILTEDDFLKNDDSLDVEEQIEQNTSSSSRSEEEIIINDNQPRNNNNVKMVLEEENNTNLHKKLTTEEEKSAKRLSMRL